MCFTSITETTNKNKRVVDEQVAQCLIITYSGEFSYLLVVVADKTVAMGSHSLSAEAKSCILFYLKAGAWSLVYYSHLNFDKMKARIHFSTSARKGSTPLKCFIAAAQKRIKNYLLTLPLKALTTWNLHILYSLFFLPEITFTGHRKSNATATMCQHLLWEVHGFTPKQQIQTCSWHVALFHFLCANNSYFYTKMWQYWRSENFVCQQW